MHGRAAQISTSPYASYRPNRVLSKQDWSDLQYLLGYIKRFPEREVVFKPKDLQLRGFCDASFNIKPDGRSYYGYIITLGNSLVVTKGGRVKTVVRSSTEAEISAVNEIVSELLWCRDVLNNSRL